MDALTLALSQLRQSLSRIAALVQDPANRKLVIIGIVGAVLLSFLCIFNTSLSLNRVDERARTDGILLKMIENNPLTLLRGAGYVDAAQGIVSSKALLPLSGYNSEELRLAQRADAIAHLDQLKPEDYDEQDYRYTLVVNQAGPSYEACKYNYPDLPNQTTELWEYYPEGGYYSLLTNKRDEKLSSYFLSTYESELPDNDFLSYRGGDYAHVLRFPNPEDLASSPDALQLPVKSAETATEKLKRYFGVNTEIVSTSSINGQSYYTVKQVYFSESCHFTDRPASNRHVVLYWVNADSYEINKYEIYVGDEDLSENLVETNKVEQEKRSAVREQVLDIFKFKEGKEVKLVNLQSYDFNAEKAKEDRLAVETLKAKNLPGYVLLPGHAELIYHHLPTVAVPGSRFDYLTDRKFYPFGDAGDLLYDLANYNYDTKVRAKYQSRMIWKLGYSGYAEFRSYDPGETRDRVLAATNPSWHSMGNLPGVLPAQVRFESERAATILPAEVYQYTVNFGIPESYPLTYAGSFPESYPADYACIAGTGCRYTYSLVLFLHGGRFHTLKLSGLALFDRDSSDSASITDVPMQIFTPSIPASAEKLRNLISGSSSWPWGDEGE